MLIPGIRNWFALAMPQPTDKNRAVQIGVHFEEVAEMIDAIHGSPYDPTLCGEVAKLADMFKKHVGLAPEAVDRKELLDSLCDQIVTSIGVAHMFGMNIEGALAEVNRSNWSKFVDGKPVFDANGKIAKPATYSPPDLTPFV
jgi:predicted HAD superfamily Cof-like phosphohydrolase